MSSGTGGMSSSRVALLARKLWAQDGDVIRSEPIAVVGAACRFPGGADTPQRLWDLLLAGQDVVSEVPADRWDADAWFSDDPATPGRMNSRWGGFLEDVRGFDAAFFDISPREAERMDPQQRMALEVACEAIERAGIPFERLRGAAAGVFFASYHNDYTLLQYADLDTVSARTLTGTLHAVVANRISYALGLTGPSLAIDSACSSSLVATHLACQALRARDCDVALAGGVSAMLTPHVTVSLSKGGFMSPTGRCHTFDAEADGFVRAEGCGVIVLKRLSDAIAAGDHVLGVVRGSAVNQDGESTTLSAPNGLAQAELVRKALAHAGMTAEQVSLIEAHGTGTELGDPIETDALSAVFDSRDPAAGPCWLGSLKSNVGHLEAAAGVGGLIKSLLCLQHRTVPPHALFHSLNRHIDLRGGPLQVATAATPWEPATGSRIAGVSSFGVGGTNAHVLVEEAPAGLQRAAKPWEGAFLLPLSARSEGALRELCGRYAERLRAGADAGDLCRAAARRRTHHREWRVAPVAATAAALVQLLDAIENGSRPLQPVRPGAQPCFVFTGQGSQWPGMATALARHEPAFEAALAEAAAALSAAGGPDVLAEIARSAGETRLEDTDVAQCAIFAVQYALVQLLASQGVRAGAVIGHSIGELAAAVTAGILELPLAARAVVERGRLMQGTFDLGRMVSVRAEETVVSEFLRRHALDLTIAAVNGPTAIVLAGSTAEIDRAAQLMAAESVDHTRLNVRFAFHSALMAPAADALRTAAAYVSGSAREVPFFSTVSGAPLQRFDARYLADNVRSPVRFAAAVDAALGRNFTRFIEIGSHPALGRGITELAERSGTSAELAFCLHRERDALLTMRSLLAQAYAWGGSIDWDAVFPGPVPAADLPTYPWQHVQYWLPDAPDLRRPGAGVRVANTGFPGTRLSSPALGAKVFELDLRDASFAALHDHRIHGEPRLPATAFAELLRAAGEAAGLSGAAVRDLAILRPLMLQQDARVQVVVTDSGGRNEVEVFVGNEQGWERLATAELAGSEPATANGSAASADVAAAGSDFDAAAFYELLSAQGCDFGAGFRLLGSISANEHGAVGAIDPRSASSWRGAVHPAWVDAAAQLCVAVLYRRGLTRDGEAFLPWSITSYQVLRAGVPAQGRAVLREATSAGATFDLQLLDNNGALLILVEGWRVRRAAGAPAQLRMLTWEARAAEEPADAGTARSWLIFPDPSGVTRAAGDALIAAGRDATLVLEDDPERAAEQALGALQANPAAWEGILFPMLQDPADPSDAVGAVSPLLTLVRGMAVTSAPLRLLVLTRATQPVAGFRRGGSPTGAAAWGLLRVLRAESPEARCVALDLDAPLDGRTGGPREVEGIVREALTASTDAEVALRDGTRYVALDALREALPLPAPTASPCALGHRLPGTLEGFELVAAEPTPPAPGQVRIRVRAAAMNFRDVLTSLGSYPGVREFGFECSGVVDAMGEGVNSPAVGDAVIAFWPGCFGSHVNVPADFVFPAPRQLDPAAAATLPVAFGTAYYALHDVGSIDATHSVLIHAGAGGVGLAAIQLALAAGARVFATAGSAEKRALLKRLGVTDVFDSRSSSFAEDVLAATGGEGVHLVLNSLIGDLIAAGFRTLRPNGVFVELGKRDILAREEHEALRGDVRYVAFDLGERARADRSLLPRLFGEITSLLERGAIRPLPVTVHPLADAESAFRRMARAEHVGKMVLTPPPLPELAFSGWCVVTGGTGAVGRAAIRWLAARGAQCIAVWSRRAPGGEAAAEYAQLRERGVNLRIQSVDVADVAQVAAALAELRSESPITGVIHAAGVVEDATLAQQDVARLQTVMAPKSTAAWHLHAQTLHDPLELFLLCSAAGPVIDAKGQANYAAANALLDALAAHRRALGLPGVSALWGPWGDGGMAALLGEAQRERWSRLGLEWWNADNAGAAFEALLADASPHVLAVRTAVRRVQRATAQPAARGTLRQTLEATAPSLRYELLFEHTARALGTVLGIATLPAPEAPLRDAGLDSLSAIELRNALSVSLGMPLPATLAFDHPTLNAITTYLLRALGLEAAAPDAPSPDAAVAADPLLEQVQGMTDDEAEAMLLQELGLSDAAEAR